jgi:predicted AAA+ superfamily ATPase
MYIERTLTERWNELSTQFPVLLLTGPRQVGKTTLLQHIRKMGRGFVTLDNPTTRLLAQEDPALFFEQHPPPVMIDEIQYAPGLLPYIKILADRERKPGQFWLTGSQHFIMMKGISETLAGRVGIVHLLGFSRRERYELDLRVSPFLPTKSLVMERSKNRNLQSPTEVYRDAWQGSLPALVTGSVSDREVFYSSYIQTYLQRDVRDLAQIGDEAAFLTFIRACAARTGQMLNLSELARDTDVSVKTAKHWLSILQASFQVYLLKPYHSNLTKRLVKRPKLYFLDTGLCTYLTGWTSPEVLASGSMAGAILETHVFIEILKSWWHQARQPSIYYYRDKDAREIDFVFDQDGAFYSLEVKRNASPKQKWATAIPKMSHLNAHQEPGFIACLGSEVVPLDARSYAIPISLI